MGFLKERVAFASSLVGLILALISLGQHFSGRLLWFISLIWAILGSAYIVRRRVRSAIDPQELVNLYPHEMRIAANWLVRLSIFTLVFLWTPIAYVSYWRPTVQSISPDSPRIGTHIRIIGKNFHSDVQVFFSGLRASKYYRRDESVIEAEIPDGAISGPVTVANSHWSATYPWLDIDSSSLMSVISTGTLSERSGTLILFSAQNTSSTTNLTLYDVIINMLAIREGAKHLTNQRIDLGSATLFLDGETKGLSELGFDKAPASLLKDGLVVTLKPKESESFKVRVWISRGADAVFSLVGFYFDDSGNRHTASSDKVYWITGEDFLEPRKMITVKELSWNSATLRTLEENGLTITPRALAAH